MQVTIATNVPLYTTCPTYFEMTGFKDATTASYSTKLKVNGAHIVPHASGTISLLGSQHLEHDNSTWATSKEMWWAPGMYVCM